MVWGAMASMEERRLSGAEGGMVGAGGVGVEAGEGRQEMRKRVRTRATDTVQNCGLLQRMDIITLFRKSGCFNCRLARTAVCILTSNCV